MNCDKCKSNEVTHAIYSRGYWWCIKHANIHTYSNGKTYVNFPSNGKLMPKSIMKDKVEQENTMSENDYVVRNIVVRGNAAGIRMADALVEFVHLMYNKETAKRVLNAMIETLQENIKQFK